MGKSTLRLEPWDKQPNESSARYFAFCKYRDMGVVRSLAKVAKELAPVRTTSKLRQLQKWSAADNWVNRVESWDVEQDRLFRSEMQKAIKEAAKRQANEILFIQRKTLERLKDLNVNELSPEGAMKYLMDAIKLERQILGMPDKVVIESTGKPQIKARWLHKLREEECECG